MSQCTRTPGDVAGQPSVDSSQCPSLNVLRHSSSYQACGLAAPKSVHDARERLYTRRKVINDAKTSDRMACLLVLLGDVAPTDRCPTMIFFFRLTSVGS